MEIAMETTGDTSAAQLLKEVTARLIEAGVELARLNAEVLLASVCGCERAALYARRREPLAPTRVAELQELVARRCAREPLQYLVGNQEFWSLEFVVTPDVLIPRPETELLVELAIAATRFPFPPVGEGQGEGPTIRLCDVGTGSGCIAIALARELPTAEVWALDVSPAALAVARLNARRHGVAERVRCVESDLFSAVVDQRFDLIVSNPPYVSVAELVAAQPELAWEPRRALDGGIGGLEVIERLLAAAPMRLVDGGWLLMEIGAEQAPAVTVLAQAAGFGEVAVRNDYAGLPRALMARR